MPPFHGRIAADVLDGVRDPDRLTQGRDQRRQNIGGGQVGSGQRQHHDKAVLVRLAVDVVPVLVHQVTGNIPDVGKHLDRVSAVLGLVIKLDADLTVVIDIDVADRRIGSAGRGDPEIKVPQVPFVDGFVKNKAHAVEWCGSLHRGNDIDNLRARQVDFE